MTAADDDGGSAGASAWLLEFILQHLLRLWLGAGAHVSIADGWV